MSSINYSAREINCKIIYDGPALAGKDENLQYLYDKISSPSKSKMVSLATENEPNLSFNFLPVAQGEIRGFKVRFSLAALPANIIYDASRKLHLKGVDGVVLVADSRIERIEANLASLDYLRDSLAELGYDLDRIPFVIQYNNRDDPAAAPLDELKKLLNPTNVPDFEACANCGTGVFETLKAVAKLIIKELRQGR